MSGRAGADIWADLPLFLLNTVLFPGMVLPLHIFEDRYKLMIDRCLEEGRPFGVVLIREGKEVFDAGGKTVPYEVGTTAMIARTSRLDDGRMNIITIGSERFRIHGLRHDLPYLSGTAEPWPLLEATSEQAQEHVGPMRALFRQYLSLLVQAEGHRIGIEEMPTEARTLALLIAIALQVPVAQKQHLLAQASVVHMLRAERAIMRREQLLLHYVIRTQTEQWEGGFSGYLARN
jgi:Lon protease-like protein